MASTPVAQVLLNALILFQQQTEQSHRYKDVMKKTAFAVVLAALGFSAHAAVISFDAPLILETTEINQNLSLSKFDSGLGTLESVTVEFFGRGVSRATIRNSAVNPQNVRFSSVLDLLFTGPLHDTISIELFNTNTFVNIASGNTLDLGWADFSESALLSVNATSFANYIGSDQLAFNCTSIVGQSTIGGGGNIAVTQSTQAGCGAKVTYTYSANTPAPNPVPEPASLALLGLGLAGIAGLRRKKG